MNNQFLLLFAFVALLTARVWCAEEAMWSYTDPSLTSSVRRTIPPTLGKGSPTKVYVGLDINTIGHLDEKEMTLPLDVNLLLNWVDPMLGQYAGSVFDSDWLKRHWQPDIVFPTCVSSQSHPSNVQNFALYIESDGNIAYSARMTLMLYCPMDLHRYPFDEHTCALRMASHGHTVDEMPLHWFNDSAIRLGKSLQMSSYNLKSVETNECDESMDGQYKIHARTFKGYRLAKFGCIEARLHFSRRIGESLLHLYACSTMLVLVSWLQFWLDPNLVPARLTLAVVTLLSLLTVGIGLRNCLPPAPYIKAIDVWYVGCVTFAVLGLFEFAHSYSYTKQADACDKNTDHLLMKHYTKTEFPRPPANGQHANNNQTMSQSAMEESLITTNGFSAAILTTASDEYRKQAASVDNFAKVWFLLLFLLFNVVYWCYYLAPWPQWAEAAIGYNWNSLAFWQVFMSRGNETSAGNENATFVVFN